ncbi:MAG: hypothetical protein KAH07_00260 [Flavobacteriaceae bacterium]|nr:hypothetical protein [Flavobacteriaceae bacterium]
MKKVILISLSLIYSISSFSQNNENDSIQKTPEIIKKHPILEDRFIFNVGLYVPNKSIKIGANGSNPDSEIKFKKNFDFNQNESTLAMNFIWRFSKNKKWSVGIEEFSVKNSHKLMIDKDIEWDDVIYKAGASVEAGFGMNMYRLFFGRTISSGLRHELVIGLGIHAMDIEGYIKGEAYINDKDKRFEKRMVSAIVPFPNTCLSYIYTPDTKWALTARVDWFAISIDKYYGSLWNLAPGIKYQAFKNIGVGVNYRYFKTNIRVDQKNWDGKFSLIFKGPLFTISGNF